MPKAQITKKELERILRDYYFGGGIWWHYLISTADLPETIEVEVEGVEEVEGEIEKCCDCTDGKVEFATRVGRGKIRVSKVDCWCECHVSHQKPERIKKLRLPEFEYGSFYKGRNISNLLAEKINEIIDYLNSE